MLEVLKMVRSVETFGFFVQNEAKIAKTSKFNKLLKIETFPQNKIYCIEFMILQTSF